MPPCSSRPTAGRPLRWLVVLAACLPVIPASPAPATEARRAVEAFVAQLGESRVTDLVVVETIAIYDPDGRLPQSRGEQRLYVKIPGRQRVEQVIEGRREVRLTAERRTWVRRPDGTTYERPPERERERVHLLTPFRRSAADLLAEWRAFGVRDEISYWTRFRGRPVLVIGAGPDDRESPAVWLDEDLGVVRVIRRERLPTGPALVDLTLSEHRPLAAGFHFPHRQELFVGGKLLMLITVRSVEVNVGLPDALFDPEALRRGR